MGGMSERRSDSEIAHVLRYVLRRPAAWAQKDIEEFREQLTQLIDELATELVEFKVYDDFGYERPFPCETQKEIAKVVTEKWPPYPGHMHKIEEICQGVMYCLRLSLLNRAEDQRESSDGRVSAPTMQWSWACPIARRQSITSNGT
jgi:hypothetical protein